MRIAAADPVFRLPSRGLVSGICPSRARENAPGFILVPARLIRPGACLSRLSRRSGMRRLVQCARVAAVSWTSAVPKVLSRSLRSCGVESIVEVGG